MIENTSKDSIAMLPPVYFSLIVPVYKVERYLQDALDSVRAQTFQDYEVLCIDDGSPDTCGAMLDEVVRQDSRFRIIHQRNAGQGAARNRALDRVRGNYILFLDPDDALCPNWFASFVTMIKRYNPAIVTFSFQRFAEDKDWRTLEHPTFNDSTCQVASGILACAKLLWPGLRYGNTALWARAWRRDIIAHLRLPIDVREGEDTIFNWEATPLLDSMVVADYPGYYYRFRSDSLTIGHSPSHLRARQWLFAISHLLSLTWNLRGDPRQPFAILSCTPFLWHVAIVRPFLVGFKLRPWYTIELGMPPRLQTCFQHIEQGKEDQARLAILSRVIVLCLIYAIEWSRWKLCLIVEKIRGKDP